MNELAYGNCDANEQELSEATGLKAAGAKKQSLSYKTEALAILFLSLALSRSSYENMFSGR